MDGEPTATGVRRTRLPRLKKVSLRADRSTSILAVTFATVTACGLTYPTTPFGRIGSFTRYHVARHRPSSTAPTIEKVVG